MGLAGQPVLVVVLEVVTVAEHLANRLLQFLELVLSELSGQVISGNSHLQEQQTSKIKGDKQCQTITKQQQKEPSGSGAAR